MENITLDISATLDHYQKLLQIYIKALDQVDKTTHEMLDLLFENDEILRSTRHTTGNSYGIQALTSLFDTRMRMIHLKQLSNNIQSTFLAGKDFRTADTHNANPIGWMRITERHLLSNVTGDKWDISNLTNIAIDHIAQRVALRIVYEMILACNDVCHNHRCEEHIDGKSGGLIRIEITKKWMDAILNQARAIIKERAQDYIEQTLKEQVKSPAMNLIADTIGWKKMNNSSSRVIHALNANQQDLMSMSKSTPGLIGVWLHMPQDINYKDTDGEIVKNVAKWVNIKPKSMAWKILAHLPLHTAYDLASNGNDTVKVIIEMYARYANRRKARISVLKRLKAAIGKPDYIAGQTHRPAEIYHPIYTSFITESEKSVSERGYSLAQLNRELTNMLDWADELMSRHRRTETDWRAHLYTSGVDDCCIGVIPNKKWSALKRMSDAWHEEMILIARAQEEQGEVTVSWESLIDEYVSDDYTFTPLLNDLDLSVEAARAHNCVGSSAYRTRCEKGTSRIFRVSQHNKTATGKNPTNHVATVEIAKVKRDNTTIWEVRQVQGHRNRRAQKNVINLAQDLATRYQQAEMTTN